MSKTGFYVNLPRTTVREIRYRAKRLNITQADLVCRWMLLATTADEVRMAALKNISKEVK
jgi:hypothetical protein